MSLECKYPNGVPTWHTGESVVYIVDTTEWTSSPSSPSVVEVIDESDGSDATTTVMPSGGTAVTGAFITLPAFQSATVGRNYRVEVQFEGDNSAILRAHLRVRARI